MQEPKKKIDYQQLMLLNIMNAMQIYYSLLIENKKQLTSVNYQFKRAVQILLHAIPDQLKDKTFKKELEKAEDDLDVFQAIINLLHRKKLLLGKTIPSSNEESLTDEELIEEYNF